jgi:hypothetical protein
MAVQGMEAAMAVARAVVVVLVAVVAGTHHGAIESLQGPSRKDRAQIQCCYPRKCTTSLERHCRFWILCLHRHEYKTKSGHNNQAIAAVLLVAVMAMAILGVAVAARVVVVVIVVPET